MTTILDVPIEEQIACAKRELALRGRVYPRFVSDGRLTQAEADKQMAAMRAIVATLDMVRVLLDGARQDAVASLIQLTEELIADGAVRARIARKD